MSRKVNKAGSTPATAALEASGIEYQALPYAHDSRNTHYGDEAAAQLGLSPEEVFKTLVIRLDNGTFALVLVPVSGEADLKTAAAALNAKKAELASPADVQRLTGYVLGGVSPVGTRTSLATVIDVTAQSLSTMYVSGGKRGFDIGVDPADLGRLTQAVWAPVGR